METGELTEYFEAMAQDLVRLDIVAAMAVLVAAAVDTIDGCDHASLGFLDGETLRSVASNDDVGPALDRLQNEFGEGPSLDAVHGGGRVITDDLRVDSRWPRYGPPAATTTGVLSSAATALHDDRRTVGVLDLHSEQVSAFHEDVSRDSLLAVLAPFCTVVLVASAERANLERALLTRDLIGQAKGMLMAQSGIDAGTAFDLLRSASQRMNVKLADVAGRIVDGSLRAAPE